jgi:4-amino-4-deoxy-L-arabinose transferase-like glycosyltransferase
VNPWLVPVLSGKVRLQKPPLPNWCAAALFRVFKFDEGWARLVPALMAAFATLLVYDLARVLMGRVAAWVAGLVWLGSYFVFDEYRKAMVDPYLAFFTLAAVWAWVRAAKVEDGGWRMEDSGERSRRTSSPSSILHPLSSCLLFYLSLALGFLSKGPVIFLHVAIALIAYHVCYRRRRRRAPWRVRHHLLGAGLMIAVAAPWYLYVLRTVPHAWDIFRYESLGEVTADTKEDARPWFFYLLSVVQLSLPWAPLFVLGALLAFNRGRGRRKDRRPWFPLAWYAAVLVFFSFVTQKKNAYLLPALPAQTLLITQGVLLTLAAARRNRFRGPQAGLAWAQVGMGLAMAVLLAVLVAGAPDALAAGAGDEDDEGAAALSTTGKWDTLGKGLAVGAVALAAAAAPAWWVVRRRPRAWVAGQAAAYALLIALFFNLHVGPRENRRSPAPVAREMLALLAEGGRTTRFERLPEQLAVYFPVNPDEAVPPHSRFAKKVLAVVDDARGVRQRRRTGARYEDAPYPPKQFRPWVEDPAATVTEVRRVPLQSAPGDAKWKLFELTVERSALAGKGSESAWNSGVTPGPAGRR